MQRASEALNTSIMIMQDKVEITHKPQCRSNSNTFSVIYDWPGRLCKGGMHMKGDGAPALAARSDELLLLGVGMG